MNHICEVDMSNNPWFLHYCSFLLRCGQRDHVLRSRSGMQGNLRIANAGSPARRRYARCKLTPRQAAHRQTLPRTKRNRQTQMRQLNYQDFKLSVAAHHQTKCTAEKLIEELWEIPINDDPN